MNTSVILFGTLGCHLCEQAHELVAAALPATGFVMEEVDIAEDEALEQRYGIRIPVLKRMDSGAELNWPFTAEDVAALLR